MESSFEGLNFEILHESFESDANFSCNTPVIVDCDVEEAGYRELINSLQEDANFCNDVHREGEETALIGNLHAKREAIQQGRHDLLQLLLQRDDTIEDDMVVTACDRKDRGSIRILLDFGWQINKPVYNAASLLWLVERTTVTFVADIRNSQYRCQRCGTYALADCSRRRNQC